MMWDAKWICSTFENKDVVPVFSKCFQLSQNVKAAQLSVTALGVYEAELNGQRIGEFVLAPGWTAYEYRLQVQRYDVTELLKKDNQLTILVGKGWYRNPLADWVRHGQRKLMENPAGCTAQLMIEYEDGTFECIETDESWDVSESQVRFSEIYDGEIVDARIKPAYYQKAVVFDGPTHTLIETEGEEIREMETLVPCRIFMTPKQETVIDFGQNLTGIVEVRVNAQAGDIVDLSFAEVLDKEGNFYTDNYRSAKAQYHYICTSGTQTYKPKLTFYGFRYVRVNAFPSQMTINKECFKAIALYSNMRQTGRISSSNVMLNQLFQNVLWGQKGNFVDVPTDCPQRDERLGWTGDAQVFVKTACLNYDVEKFFGKWLQDLKAQQHEDGYVPHVVPDVLQNPNASTAWGDAAVICPWEVYLAYGNPDILQKQYESMCKWIHYITTHTTTPYLWTGGEHYGDWLGLDAPSGSYKGLSREDFIASAFYARSVELTIKAGRVLNRDVCELKRLYHNIVKTFQDTYFEYRTQTECVLAAHFHLAKDPHKAAAQLKDKVIEAGVQLETGFVGTPYLLHVLSDYGYADLAYTLLLKQDYPSWLYPITKGATTVWEHWDGIHEDGTFWSADMNSFNHYAYGSVCDLIYTKAAGIQVLEDAPGYQRVRIAPIVDQRLDWLSVHLKTRYGLIESSWRKQENMWRYDITVPVDAEIVIDGQTHRLTKGSYCFFLNQ